MKMTDETLARVLDAELQQSVTWAADSVREEQIRNLQYYLGYPLGNETKGRSQVVSWDVFEIVESALPGLIEPFFSGDNIGDFQPRQPEDEAFASQATDYVNYLIKDRNEGFLIFNTWIKDALMSKVGVVRAEWADKAPKKLELRGLSDEQMAMLAQDEASEIVEYSAEPMPGMPPMNEAQMIQMGGQMPMLHNVTVMQKQAGCVEIENVRPENFIVSRNCGTLAKARIIGETVIYTRSELKQMGFKNYADVSSYEVMIGFENGEVDQLRDGGEMTLLNDDKTDPSLEEVKLFRGYVRADVNGDGIAEWRRVLVGSGEKPFLENEEAEFHDYCVLTPIPIPHRVIGMAYADPASEIQRIKTTLTRQYLDSLYLANRPRTYVNINAGVNMDDILSDRIGGIVRGTQPYANAVAPMVTSAVARDALEGIQFADGMRESRLGIPKINPGIESDALHKTATGTRSVNAAVDKRQKMTLRIMAETGIKDLFRLVLRLTCKYQDKAATIRLRNQWVEFNPAQWNPDMDVVIAVGIGSSDQIETMGMLQQFGAFMQWGQSVGVVTPPNVYEFGVMLAKNAKMRGADEKLLTKPGPPQPPPPDPKMQLEQAKMQAAAQEAQAKRADDAQRFQAEAQMQIQIDQNRQESEARQKSLELIQTGELEKMRAMYQDEQQRRELQYKEWFAQYDRETKLMLANLQSRDKQAAAEHSSMDRREAAMMTGEQGGSDV